jgi:hypothetical protein
MSAIPAPLFALVGATDAVTAKARTLPEKLAEIEIRRFERPTVDVPSVQDIKDLDVQKLDPRKISLPNVDLSRNELRKPSMDMSEVAGKGLQLAARAERAYEDFVTRGEQVVAKVRGRDETETPVATPAKAKADAPKKATKAATKPVTKPATKATKPAAKKANTSTSDTK